MSIRRGLTLIEVLAATVLLSMLAAACIPLIRLAMSDLRDQEKPLDLTELSIFVDEILAAPSEFNIDPEMFEQSIDCKIDWPGSPDGTYVVMRRLENNDPNADHAWLKFSCNNQSVFRWILIDNENDQESQL